jgi:hypothetical protein
MREMNTPANYKGSQENKNSRNVLFVRTRTVFWLFDFGFHEVLRKKVSLETNTK